MLYLSLSKPYMLCLQEETMILTRMKFIQKKNALTKIFVYNCNILPVLVVIKMEISIKDFLFGRKKRFRVHIEEREDKQFCS